MIREERIADEIYKFYSTQNLDEMTEFEKNIESILENTLIIMKAMRKEIKELQEENKKLKEITEKQTSALKNLRHGIFHSEQAVNDLIDSALNLKQLNKEEIND